MSAPTCLAAGAVHQQPKVTPCSKCKATAGVARAGLHLLVWIFMLKKKKKGKKARKKLLKSYLLQ